MWFAVDSHIYHVCFASKTSSCLFFKQIKLAKCIRNVSCHYTIAVIMTELRMPTQIRVKTSFDLIVYYELERVTLATLKTSILHIT